MIKDFFFFGFLYYHFFKKAQNKNKARIEMTFSLMTKIHKAKSPKQFHFHLGRGERFLFF